jgi:hypothetical protein
MFKNREFIVRMNKPSGIDNETFVNDIVFEDRAAIMHAIAKDLVKTVCIVICGRIVLETIGQVLIAVVTSDQT